MTTGSLHSMTGFAQSRSERDGCAVTVSLRSVNHRQLEIRVQAPPELEAAVPALEKQARAVVARGHVSLRCACESRMGGTGLRLEEAAVADYLAAHAELARRLGVTAPPAAADVLRAPGVLVPALSSPVPLEHWAGLAATALASALAELQRMRAAEGAALAADLAVRLARMRAAVASLTDLRQELEAGLRERISERMRELLADASPSPERILQEAALQASRGDISEELTRLNAHLAQCRSLLLAGGEVGKKLDFLTQELNREANTLLAKSSSGSDIGLQVSEIGLGLKAEIEKFREQVQNLE